MKVPTKAELRQRIEELEQKVEMLTQERNAWRDSGVCLAEELKARRERDTGPASHHERVSELEAEVLHWQKVAIDPEVLVRPTDVGMDMEFRHQIVGWLYESALGMLGDAPNYVAMDVSSADGPTMTITVQRTSANGPHRLAEQYRARLEAMGVTDLAPLPPKLEAHAPWIRDPHLVLNARAEQVECRKCGAMAAHPNDSTLNGSVQILEAFRAVHGKCVEDSNG
jgi:hypothetical protein